MQCPVCDERLREVERHGVMIDICPSCKGVWLDRGELEKVAKMEARDDVGPGDDRRERRYDDRDDYDGRPRDDYDGRPRDGRRRRRGSFLSDLMEGFGD